MESKFYSKLFTYIETNNSFSSLDFSDIGFEKHSEALLSLKSLKSFGHIFLISEVKRKFWCLTEKGEEFLRNSKQKNVQNILEVDKLFNSLVKVKEENVKSVDENFLKECEENNYIKKGEIDSLEVSKGNSFADNLVLADDLTADMIGSDSWNNLVLSSYDYNKMGLMEKFGGLHVIYNFGTAIREALFELGFKEVHVSNYVEKYSKEDADKALEETDNVYSVHLNENTNEEEACSKTYYLRSSLFNRLLSEISILKSVPSKLFTIGKVFQNREFDSLDIPEYHSLEMMISDVDLDLSNVLGICAALFSRLNIGFTDFKQAYFPYTSPTVGIYLYNEILDAWISVGKGGIVRPEVMKKLGYNDNMFILRLGFSLERVLLNKNETDDMSNLL
ncbi:unnamed protein product [Nezara viridula]|uniref:Aminoacyl-transfer RNA synthetases class-II family profile domain-containing protein n=1 Tax=Nezara viridula TaxID=85310 RepID=A0A9P0HUK0_NEZVI|nr:unnamed protein product [Nezara viridula]